MWTRRELCGRRKQCTYADLEQRGQLSFRLGPRFRIRLGRHVGIHRQRNTWSADVHQCLQRPVFGVGHRRLLRLSRRTGQSCTDGNFAMLSDQATTYKALVSAMSSEESVCKDMTRVTPGDPMKSLLYLKLSSMQTCGMPMPPGTPLSAEIVSMIRDWIMAGAKDD
jgi:hypothetical protein